MTEQIIYRSDPAPLCVDSKRRQFFEIKQIPGKVKGARDFVFNNNFMFPNGTVSTHIGCINVRHLRNLLDVLKQMESDGFLDNENVE